MTTEEMKALGRVAIQAWNAGRPELLVGLDHLSLGVASMTDL